MKKSVLILAGAAMLLSSCGSVPITGRKQLNLVSDSEVLQSSLSQYKNYMSSATISGEQAQSEQVTRVGKKLAAATEAYLKATGLESEISNFQWEFNLVKNDEINAFCMPGGKIVVYEGLMKLVSSDDELAVVLGHEVAHAVAKHSKERMSQQILAQYGAQAVSAITKGKSYSTQQIASKVYGLGANYGVMLPYSRKHESEADKMGLVLMSLAGYNPRTALTFWQKMSSASSASVPEFMSDHPSDANRIAAIEKDLPAIESEYATYINTGKQSTATKTTTTTTTKKKTTTTKKKATKKSKKRK